MLTVSPGSTSHISGDRGHPIDLADHGSQERPRPHRFYHSRGVTAMTAASIPWPSHIRQPATDSYLGLGGEGQEVLEAREAPGTSWSTARDSPLLTGVLGCWPGRSSDKRQWPGCPWGVRASGWHPQSEITRLRKSKTCMATPILQLASRTSEEKQKRRPRKDRRVVSTGLSGSSRRPPPISEGIGICGCFYHNPPSTATELWLKERLGLRGLRTISPR